MTKALAHVAIEAIQDTNNVKTLGFADFGPDDIDAILAADETCFPSTYYQLSTARIPMTAEAFGATFGAGTLSLIGTNQLLGNTGVRTNIAMGTSLNCCFWLRDVRFVLIPEAETWALGGASITAPAAPAHEQPAFTGAFPLGGVLTPAQLEYGKASQIAARKLRESFDLQFAIGCEFVLINTSLARVSCTQFEAASLGFGSPNTAMAEKIRLTNDRARANARGVTFLPQNSIGAEVSGGSEIGDPPTWSGSSASVARTRTATTAGCASAAGRASCSARTRPSWRSSCVPSARMTTSRSSRPR